MRKNKYTIRRNQIPNVRLVSLTGQTWYDSNDNLISWSGNTGNLPTGFTPSNGYVVYNITGGTINGGYYKWGVPTGNTWNAITGTTSYINIIKKSNR